MPIYVGQIVIYSWPQVDLQGRRLTHGAGWPDCPAVVLEVAAGDRLKIRALGEFDISVRGYIPYSTDGGGNTWRFPDVPIGATAAF